MLEAHKRGLDLEKLDSLPILHTHLRRPRRTGSGTKGGTQNGRVRETERQRERERESWGEIGEGRGAQAGIALHNLKTMVAHGPK